MEAVIRAGQISSEPTKFIGEYSYIIQSLPGLDYQHSTLDDNYLLCLIKLSHEELNISYVSVYCIKCTLMVMLEDSWIRM